MKNKIYIGLIAIIISCIAISCKKDKKDKDDDPTPGNNGCNVVYVTENITSPTVWTEGSVYVISGNISVQSELTIQPGVIIKLSNAMIRTDGSGKIIANGTAAKHIVFTSIADDNYCGDTNGDGTATSPQKGDWEKIYLNSNGSVLKYCDIFYAGLDNGNASALELSVSASQVTIDYCTIAHTLSDNTNYSAAFWGWEYTVTGETVFTNNVMYDNDQPMVVHHNYTVDTSNVFHNPANPGQTNQRNGIFLLGTGALSGTVTYGVTEVPYVIDFVEMVNTTGQELIINSGVIVKFGPNPDRGIFDTQDGGIFTYSPGAIFTSYKDDTRGGDTNGDGNASSPADGDWDGIKIGSSYLTSSNIFYDSH